MSEVLTPVVYELGLGAVGGFVVGFALKKIAIIFLIVIGIFVAALLYLGASDIITINFGQTPSEAKAKAEDMCKRLLANPTKDNYTIAVEEQK